MAISFMTRIKACLWYFDKIMNHMCRYLFGLFAVLPVLTGLVSCDKPHDRLPEGETFEFELVSKTTESITVAVIPKDKNIRYYAGAMEKEVYDERWNGDLSGFPEVIFENWKNSFDDDFYGYASLEDCYYGETSTGTDTIAYVGLKQLTQAYVYAFGLNPDGTVSTDVYVSEAYVTDEVSPSDNKFVISRVEDTSIQVEPSNNDPYCCYMLTKDAFDTYGGAEKVAEAYIETNYYKINTLVAVGRQIWDFSQIVELYGPGNYVAMAFGTQSGALTTEVETLEFEYGKELPTPEDGEKFSNLVADAYFEPMSAYWEWGGTFDPYAVRLVFRDMVSFENYEFERDRMSLCFQVAKNKVPYDMAGEYEISADLSEGTVVQGWRVEEEEYGFSEYFGSLYSWRGNISNPDASIDSGTVVLKANGDGTYTVDVRGYDMNGYQIRASYTGNIEMKV